MNRLKIDHINDRAPYDVAYDEDGAIVFATDYGVEYSVTFDDDSNPYFSVLSDLPVPVPVLSDLKSDSIEYKDFQSAMIQSFLNSLIP